MTTTILLPKKKKAVASQCFIANLLLITGFKSLHRPLGFSGWIFLEVCEGVDWLQW
jgi:hypothetical protein